MVILGLVFRVQPLSLSMYEGVFTFGLGLGLGLALGLGLGLRVGVRVRFPHAAARYANTTNAHKLDHERALHQACHVISLRWVVSHAVQWGSEGPG